MSVGSTLSEARRRAGLSLEDVGAVTRLRPSLIAAMENDDFVMCGGDTYARGHVRSVAIAIGIDPDAAVAEYDAERRDTSTPASMRMDFENGRRSIDDAPRSPNWNRVMTIALLVVLVIIFIALISKSRG